MPRSDLMRRLLVIVLAVVLVAVVALVGVGLWKRWHRTPLEQALDLVPAGSLRVGFTDWAVVRRTLHAKLGGDPSSAQVQAFMSKAYDSDFSSTSSMDSGAAALQEHYGFSPANAQWEAYAQSKQGATMVLKVAQGADFETLAANLRTAGYIKPSADDGVWKGGIDLVAGIDGSISPELQYVVLLKKQGLVVTSDTSSYAATAASVARGDGDSLGSTDRVDGLAGPLGQTANAEVWSGDFACQDLAMGKADSSDQATAQDLVQQAGGVTPLSGLAMGMEPSRRLRVVEGFEDSGQADRNLAPRAKLAVGDAVGRGGSFSDDFKLTTSRTMGSAVVLDLTPRQSTGYVLSALYDGPVLFATC